MIDKATTDSREDAAGTMPAVMVMPRRGEVTEVAARLPIPVAIKNRSRWPKIFFSGLITFTALGGSALYWWNQARDQLPAGIAWSNGRIEADEIDIDTKFAGRIAQLHANEGDMVSPGDIVALMDVRDLEATLKRTEAQVLQAQRAVDEARAAQEQQRTQVALEAGRIRAGADSRIVLDAYPNTVLPAKVSFIATQSQFTPKMVETRSERDRLMFRVRVRIDPDLLRAHSQQVRSGLPGLAFVLADANAQWPARLRSTVTK